ncbi:MAG: V4R domain-containing protein [Longimicrobiales bacterium]
MGPTNSRPAELALPVASLAALRRSLAANVGADGAAHALQDAGHAAGDAFFRALCRQPGAAGQMLSEETAPEVLREIGEAAFWRRFSNLFASRGWGTFAHSAVHAGVGALQSADWVESDSVAGAVRPSCFFSTGLLANLLGQIAGQEIAVMEVECRSQGDGRCRFLFGGPGALEELFHRIESGQDIESSLSALA